LAEAFFYAVDDRLKKRDASRTMKAATQSHANQSPVRV
jgi:hypothetical protein